MTGSSRSKPVVEWARRLGCEVTRTRKHHFKVTFGGKWVGNIAGTPSSKRSPINDQTRIIRNLKKMENN